jgi:hypothetical protein
MSGMFGPQTANAVTTKPSNTAVQRYGALQTWFKDCSGPGASDGTVPDAAFYNRIVGALDYIIAASGASGIAGDDSFLYRAILQMVSQDAPDALNSLRELAAAIQDDPNFAGTVMNMLANRLRFDQAQFLNSTQKAQAIANLGLAAVATSGDYSALANLPALGTAAPKNVGTGANNVVQLDGSGRLPAVDGSQLTGLTATGAPNRNRFMNGGFTVYQRAQGVNITSGGYGADGAYMLHESGNVTGAQLTDPEPGAAAGLSVTQADATAKRIGVCLPVESVEARDLRSSAITVSGRLKTSSSGITRFALLETTAAADGFTKNVVNNWASTTFTAGNFFAAGVNVLAVGAVTPSVNTWTNILLNGTAGGSMNNLILFVWSDSQLAQTSTLMLNRCKLEAGNTKTAFELGAIADTMTKCQRWYERVVCAYSSVASSVQTGRAYQATYGWRTTKRTVVNPTLSATSTTRCAAPTVNVGGSDGFSLTTSNSNADGDDFSYGTTATADVSIGV